MKQQSKHRPYTPVSYRVIILQQATTYILSLKKTVS